MTGGQPVRIPPTQKDLKNGRTAAPAHTAVIQLTVEGTIRDVQANALQGITVSAGKRKVQTDEKGMYQLQALSSDTLTVAGAGYKTERIPVDGRQVIHVRLLLR